MQGMKITRVADRRTRKKFHDTARSIYRDDPVWVCPLDKDIESIFDPAINPYFKHGEADRWILEDEKGILSEESPPSSTTTWHKPTTSLPVVWASLNV
jgi:hypothetical protein